MTKKGEKKMANDIPTVADYSAGDLVAAPGTPVSFKAGMDITKGQLVYLSADMTVSPGDATHNPVGVAANTISSGDVASIWTFGPIVCVTAGGIVARGDSVRSDASSKAVTTADFTLNTGTALTSGVADGKIFVLLR